METLFWSSVAFVGYVYLGYPALLGVWAALTRRFGRERGRPALHVRGGRDAQWPGVTVVIAARNEAGRLPARIDNLLASEYPADRLQITAASDGSTHGTVAAQAPCASRDSAPMPP